MVTWLNASAQRSLFATPTRYPGGKRRTEVAQGAETEGPVAGDDRTEWGGERKREKSGLKAAKNSNLKRNKSRKVSLKAG